MEQTKKIKGKARRRLQQQILSVLDIEDLLLVLGIEFDHSTVTEIKALCPFHTDSKPSFRIIHDKEHEKFGLYYCHGCKEGGNVFGLVKRLLDDVGDPVDYLSRFVGVNPHGRTVDDDIKQTIREREIVERKPKVKGQKFDPRRLAERVLNEYCRPVQKSDAAWQYLKSRGITNDEIERQGWLVAYKSTREIYEDDKFPEFKSRRVVLPIGYKTGKRTYFARLLPNFKGPKTLMASGDGMRDPFLYPMPTDWDYETVFIVEGPFDSIRMNKLMDEDSITVSVLGSSISVEQVLLIMGMKPKNIVVVPDGDLGGQILIGAARGVFSSSLPVGLKRIELPEGHDPDDCPEDKLQEVIDPQSWLSLYDKGRKQGIKVGYNKPLRKRKGL